MLIKGPAPMTPDIRPLVYRDILAYFHGDEAKAQKLMEHVNEAANA